MKRCEYKVGVPCKRRADAYYEPKKMALCNTHLQEFRKKEFFDRLAQELGNPDTWTKLR